jgi:Domain of unknown function (DUF4157)
MSTTHDLDHARDRDLDDDDRARRARESGPAPGRIARTDALRGGSPRPSGIVARKADGNNGVHDHAEQSLGTAASSSGSALPAPIQRKFEQSLGADLSGVRVHTGSESAAAAKSVSAKAYTVGQDVHFGAGHYDPSSATGERLLAHEVAHTVQQSGGAAARKAQFKLEVSTPGDHHEVEADRAADAMVIGDAASVAGTATAGPSRKVMREGEPKAGGGPDVDVGSKITIAKVEFGPQEAGPVEISLELSGDILVQSVSGGAEEGGGEPAEGGEPGGRGEKAGGGEPAGGGEKASGGEEHHEGKTKIEGGGAYDTQTGGVGVRGKIAHEFGSKILGMETEVEGGAEITSTHGKVGVGITLSTDLGPVKVKVSPVEFDIVKWEEGEEPEIACLELSGTAEIPGWSYTAGGKTYQLKASPTVAVSIAPNKEKIAEWLLEKLGEEAAADVALAASLIAGGVLTIGTAIYQIATSDEIPNRMDAAVGKCKKYCHGWVAGAQGISGGSAAGHAAGAKWLEDMKAKFPPAIVKQKVAESDLYHTAWNIAWPQIKEGAIAAYWKEHWLEHKIYGDEGCGGGFHVLKMCLDAPNVDG